MYHYSDTWSLPVSRGRQTLGANKQIHIQTSLCINTYTYVHGLRSNGLLCRNDSWVGLMIYARHTPPQPACIFGKAVARIARSTCELACFRPLWPGEVLGGTPQNMYPLSAEDSPYHLMPI